MSELVVWMESCKIRNLCREEEKCEERKFSLQQVTMRAEGKVFCWELEWEIMSPHQINRTGSQGDKSHWSHWLARQREILDDSVLTLWFANIWNQTAGSARRHLFIFRYIKPYRWAPKWFSRLGNVLIEIVCSPYKNQHVKMKCWFEQSSGVGRFHSTQENHSQLAIK